VAKSNLGLQQQPERGLPEAAACVTRKHQSDEQEQDVSTERSHRSSENVGTRGGNHAHKCARADQISRKEEVGQRGMQPGANRPCHRKTLDLYTTHAPDRRAGVDRVQPHEGDPGLPQVRGDTCAQARGKSRDRNFTHNTQQWLRQHVQQQPHHDAVPARCGRLGDARIWPRSDRRTESLGCSASDSLGCQFPIETRIQFAQEAGGRRGGRTMTECGAEADRDSVLRRGWDQRHAP
jgi:hypothetical protein